MKKVYGSLLPNGEISYRWYAKPWAGRMGRCTHVGFISHFEEIVDESVVKTKKSPRKKQNNKRKNKSEK